MSLRLTFRNLFAAALIMLPMLSLPARAGADRRRRRYLIHVAPPALPVYEQPPLPAPGYHLDSRLLGLRGCRLLLGSRRLGATSQRRPSVDPWLLGLCGRSVRLARGYWGPHVGFYGGVNYGFGYRRRRLLRRRMARRSIRLQQRRGELRQRPCDQRLREPHHR